MKNTSKSVIIIGFITASLSLLFFQNCGNVNLLNPNDTTSLAIPTPLPEPAPAPNPAPIPDKTQPYVNRVITQGTGAENFFCGSPISSGCINPTDGRWFPLTKRF